MSFSRSYLSVAAFVVVGACSGKAESMDESLRQDLSLASQAYMPQPYMSPLEAGYQGAYPPNAYAPPGYAPPGYAPVPYAYPQPVARTPVRTVRRSSAGATGGGGGGTRVIKNTKRDAAIGAVAGAAIGAVTSGRRDRMKGAVLGAAVGAVLGGVVGNNVDIKRVPQ